MTAGIICGLGTAFCWAGSGIVHTHISRQIGINNQMIVRMPLATSLLFVACLLFGLLVPPTRETFWLALVSGLTGILMGDASYYRAALSIGLRATQVCRAMQTCFTALLGVLILGETIGLAGWLGIVIATAGVIIVNISERHDAHAPELNMAQAVRGIGLALLSALFLSIGLIFSKQALLLGMDALTLTFYRNLFASSTFLLVMGLFVGLAPAVRAIRERPYLGKYFLLGSIVGPTLGVWLSCMAIKLLPVALASVLISLQPIAMLIILSIVERRLPRLQSIVGTFIAVGGAIILLLRHFLTF